MSLVMHLQLAGIGMIGLALAHLAFPRRLGWREELAQLSLLNRQIFWVHTFFICLVLVMMGLLSLLATAHLLAPTPLARWVLAGFALFWGIRLIVQWFVYDPRLWRGNRLHTWVHGVFSGIWVYLTTVYTWAWWSLRS
jgi:hypothetical protein